MRLLPTYLIVPTAVFVFLVTLFSFTSLTHAESVVWSTTEEAAICPIDYQGAPRCTAPGIWGPHIDIQYHVLVTNADTGAPITCGSTVPVGTHLTYSFLPHTYQDIYWFATSRSYDSPYGDWIAQGGSPGRETFCQAKNYYDTIVVEGINGAGPYDQFSSLSVSPPDKTLAVSGPADCMSNGTSKTCTATATGILQASFNFSPTTGHFWLGEQWSSYPQTGPCTPSSYAFEQPGSLATPIGNGQWSNQGPYTLQVPAQSISCPITVTEPVGNPPATPQLNSSGQCVIGTPHAINFVSTDPDNDNLKYGVDWDANGTVDQWVPPSGYVASGSTQTANRTYSIAGAKTVKVLAQDQNGLSSSWASISFTCAGGSTTAALNEGSDVSGDDTGGDDTQLLLLPDLDLRVIPSLVRSGNTTKVNWSSANVQSCTVTAPNGDSWTGLQSILGGNISKPITAQTTYTLSCLDINGGTQIKQATVRIIPTFQEI